MCFLFIFNRKYRTVLAVSSGCFFLLLLFFLTSVCVFFHSGLNLSERRSRPLPPCLGRPTDAADKELFSADGPGKTLQRKYLPTAAPTLAVSPPISRPFLGFFSLSLYRRSVHLSLKRSQRIALQQKPHLSSIGRGTAVWLSTSPTRELRAPVGLEWRNHRCKGFCLV